MNQSHWAGPNETTTPFPLLCIINDNNRRQLSIKSLSQ